MRRRASTLSTRAGLRAAARAVFAAAVLVAACGAAAAGQFVRSSPRDVPLSARVDLVVVGGNEGGVAAAWKAARSGSSVLVVSGNYFFSDDVAAKARYWLEPDEVPRSEFAKALFGEPDRRTSPAEIAPAAYKKEIEQLLLDASVQFHFNSRPAGVLIDEAGNVAGVVTANKAGLQAVAAKVVIDATPTGALARMAGAKTPPWQVETVAVSRVVHGADVPGARRIGAFREYALDAPMPGGSWPERCRAEVLLREHFNRVEANKAHAHAMHMIEPVGIASESRDAAADWPGAAALDLDRCRPRGIAHLYVLSQSADVPRRWAEKLTRPVHLAELGERIGERAHREAAARPAPTALSVKPLAGRPCIEGADVAELLSGHRGYARVDLGRVPQPETAVPVWGRYDVIVVGGGTSGIPAAFAAARNGAKVLVLEMLGHLGGNRELGTPGYWKGYPHGFNRHRWRAARAFAELRKEGVEIWYNTFACGAVKERDRVRGVVVATPLGRGAVLGTIVIDATGDADVCAAAGAEFHYLNDGDLCIQEASFRDLGLYGNVLPIDHADVHSLTMHHVLARRAGRQDVWDFYPMVGIRETRLVRGDHVIDVLDQIIGRTYRDLIGVSWSAYDPHGYHNSDYIYAGLMPPTKHEVRAAGKPFVTYFPLRSLLPRGLDGIMVVGRSHSVTHDVQASVRMNGDLINFGYAAGWAAAQAVKTGTTLRRLDLGPVQDHLVEIGNISQEDRLERCVDTPEPTDDELKAAAGDPATKRQMAALLRAGRRSLPYLRASFAAEPTLQKAKALCVLGDRTPVEYLAAWLDEQPLGTGLAYDWEAFLSVSDVEGVLWLLGVPGDERAVPALLRKLDECGTSGSDFNHVRAVTTALGRVGSPAAAAALHRFLNREGVRGHVDVAGDPKSLHARAFVKSYVELHAAAALARCGDHDGLGKEILTAYLDDWRGIFVRYAGHVLEETADALGGEP
jgi:NADPH-dependent 2,4-dienoyl-CoA reductase/sulfur reductase-like enzyme